MRHEVIFNRDNGDVVKLVTLTTSNVFISSGYEQEQFALVKNQGSDEWIGYYPKTFPKNMSRQDYMENHKPNSLFGVITIGESIKAGMEATKLFFS